MGEKNSHYGKTSGAKRALKIVYSGQQNPKYFIAYDR